MIWADLSTTLSGDRASKPTHTVPSGTGLILDPLLAVNCQATIVPSLRDKNRSTRCPHFRSHIAASPIEDEDDYEYENESLTAFLAT